MARQDRAIKTRKAIITAAAELFGERGYHGTSTADICTRGGVTPGALYFHFPTKEAIADAVAAAQEDVLRVPKGDNPLQALITLTFTYADRLIHDPVHRGVVRLGIEQATYRTPDSYPYRMPEAAVRTLLDQAAQAGQLLPTAPPDRIARLLVGTFTGVQLVSEAATGRDDLPERLADLWRYLLPSIAPPSLLPHLRIPEGGGCRST